MSAKERLDVALVARGLAETRAKAQASIMSGIVYVNGQKVDKAGAPVAASNGPTPWNFHGSRSAGA